MKRFAAVMIGLSFLLAPGVVGAQTPRTLDGFVAEANRIPMNASSALRPSAHRLKGEVERAFRTVGQEIRGARASGRTAPACPPDRISLNPVQMLSFLNAIPQERRQRMTVTDGIRTWMANRYPCPA